MIETRFFPATNIAMNINNSLFVLKIYPQKVTLRYEGHTQINPKWKIGDARCINAISQKEYFTMVQRTSLLWQMDRFISESRIKLRRRTPFLKTADLTISPCRFQKSVYQDVY